MLLYRTAIKRNKIHAVFLPKNLGLKKISIFALSKKDIGNEYNSKRQKNDCAGCLHYFNAVRHYEHKK